MEKRDYDWLGLDSSWDRWLGVHYDMPNSEYFTLPGLSQSRLKMFLSETPEKARAMDVQRDEFTIHKQRDLGTIVHAYLLEPETAASQFTCYSPEKGSDNIGTSNYCTEWIQTQTPLIKKAMLQQGKDIADAVNRRRIVQHLLHEPQDVETEVVYVWKDPETGILMHAKIDFQSRSRNYIGDVKSSIDIRQKSCLKMIERYPWYYYLQCGVYMDAVWLATAADNKTETWEPERWHWLFVENEPSYQAQGFTATIPHIDKGRQDYRRLLKDILVYANAEHWPTYPDHPILLEPSYYF